MRAALSARLVEVVALTAVGVWLTFCTVLAVTR